jgi:hypothetical protein
MEKFEFECLCGTAALFPLSVGFAEHIKLDVNEPYSEP